MIEIKQTRILLTAGFIGLFTCCGAHASAIASTSTDQTQSHKSSSVGEGVTMSRQANGFDFVVSVSNGASFTYDRKSDSMTYKDSQGATHCVSFAESH